MIAHSSYAKSYNFMSKLYNNMEFNSYLKKNKMIFIL